MSTSGRLVVLGFVCACGVSPAERMLAPIEPPWIAERGRCTVPPAHTAPLVVEWPAAERGSLERRLHRGLAIVRYEGCTIEVQRRCSLPASSYRYGAFTRKAEEVRMRNADELWANLPVGAAKLELELRRADALTVAMELVGMYEADRDFVHLDELTGDCSGATHVVTGVQVGAYAFWAESSARIGAGAGMTNGPSIGAGTSAHRELLAHDGEPAACASTSALDEGPPSACGTPIRLELVPLGERRSTATACPGTMRWTGTQCERTPQAGADASGCADGMTRVVGDVALGDFCLDRTEVTVAAYAECVRAGSCGVAGSDPWWPDIAADDRAVAAEACNRDRSERAAHPMNCVTWAKADAFCRQRDARLPTDGEWAWAATGGVQGRDYPWGDGQVTASHVNACGVECRAWFERRGRRRRMLVHDGDDGWPTTAEVGKFPAGEGRWGQLDLAGNVAEWTATEAGRERMRVRGGSFWDQRVGWLRSDDTSVAHPERRDPTIGFRCAAEVREVEDDPQQ